MEKLLERLVLTIFDSKAPQRNNGDDDDGPWIDDHKTFGGPAKVQTKRGETCLGSDIS